jgi:hypothetical protein
MAKKILFVAVVWIVAVGLVAGSAQRGLRLKA